MLLSNFTSLLEIAATLLIAFVAVDKAKEFTILLANKIFDFNKTIESKATEITSELNVSIESLLSLSNNKNNEKENAAIQKIQREAEKVIEDISTAQKLHTSILEKCHFKSFSALSFFLFLYTLSALFVSGFENTTCISMGWGLATVLTLIYTFAAWFLGEKGHTTFVSIKWSIIIFLLIVVISTSTTAIVLFYSIFSPRLPICSSAITYTTIFLPFLNFAVYTFMVHKKSSFINSEIDDRFSTLKKNGQSIGASCKELHIYKKVLTNLQIQQL